MDALSFVNNTDADNTTDVPDKNGDPTVQLTLSVIECIFMAVGTVGNVLLFILMQSKRMKRYSFSVYFSFTAVFNTLSIFWICLEDAYYVINGQPIEEIASPWSFGCGVLKVLDSLTDTSFWLMMSLSFDRFVSICHPLRAEVFCKRKIAFVICIFVTLITFVYGLPWSLIRGPPKSVKLGDPVACGHEPNREAFGIITPIAFLVVPVCFITVCNILILYNLQKKRAFRLSEETIQQGEYMSNLNRMNKAIFYLLIVTLLAWLPFTLMNLIQLGEDTTSVAEYYARYVTEIICIIPFVQDFYLLMLLSPIYRREFKLQCLRLPCCRHGHQQSLDQEDGPVSYVNLDEEEHHDDSH